jgi:predicted ATPase
MSDGELAFIAFLSLICAPDDLSGTLFLVEEPENYLHPRLIETLFGLLRQVQQEVADRKVLPSQILITTHSPYVLDQLKLDEVAWVEKRNGETSIVRPNEKTHLRKLVEDNELGIGDLAFTGALGGE